MMTIATLPKGSRQRVRVAIVDGAIELRVLRIDGLQQFVATDRCVRLDAATLPALCEALAVADRLLSEGGALDPR